MLKSISIALLCIALVIGFLFRSLRICIISLVPNVLPLLITLAVMVLAGWTIEATSAMVFTIGLGLAVDDSIHMLARYYEEQQEGGSNHEIMQRSIMRTGRALFITTVVLVIGFGINVFSDFPFLKIFGTLGSVAIGSALLCDFFFLPPLLNRWGTARYKKSRSEAA
jgi:predicted RND superfamily exporter protein